MSVINLVQSPIAVHNLHGPDNNVANRHGSITSLLNAARGGLGGFNEFNSKDLSFLKAEAALRGLNVSIVGLNGIIWSPAIYKVGSPRVKKIMQGGYVGADGVSTARKGDDDRRVGPSRYGIYFPVEVIALQFTFELDVTHLMARAFTVHKWRIGLFWRSVNSLADGVLESNGVLFGDMNVNQQINLPGVSDVSVPAPPDMGKQHYTQVKRWGQHLFITAMRAVNTPSDHHLLVGRIYFYRSPQPNLGSSPDAPSSDSPVVSKLPVPGQGGVNWKRYGAPTAHPWANRSIRFKRRNKSLWKRIAKWQAAYKRRL